MSSVGIEGTTVRLRDQYLAQGYAGFKAYVWAFIYAYSCRYKRSSAEVTIDDTTFEVMDLLSLMVVNQPYYGFGMKVVPRARFDDQLLHVLCINSGLFKSAMGVITAFTIGNQIGEYKTGRQVSVKLERPLTLQVDGNVGWEADAFTFTVIPKALKIKC